jgi:hypothetical protein
MTHKFYQKFSQASIGHFRHKKKQKSERHLGGLNFWQKKNKDSRTNNTCDLSNKTTPNSVENKNKNFSKKKSKKHNY